MKDSVSGLEALDLSANFTTEVTNVQNLDNIGIQIVWSGTSPLGEFFVETSNNYDQRLNTGDWAALGFGATIEIASNSGDHLISINQVPFAWLRIRYARTSGIGTTSITSVIKQIGG